MLMHNVVNGLVIYVHAHNVVNASVFYASMHCNAIGIHANVQCSKWFKLTHAYCTMH